MKAVVIQKNNGKAYVMTQDGQFKSIKDNKKMEVGDTIELNSNPYLYKNMIKVAIAASLIFALMLAAINFKSPEVYAYVSVDINPSIEAAIDKNGTILSAKSFNDDGKKILSNISYKGLNIEDFIVKTIKESEKLGFLKSGGTVIITTVPLHNAKNISDNVKTAANTVQNTNKDIKIETFNTDEKHRDEAKKISVSPGRLLLWQNAKADGINIPKNKLNSNEFFKELEQAYTKIQQEKDKIKATASENQNNTNKTEKENQNNNMPAENKGIADKSPVKVDNIQEKVKSKNKTVIKDNYENTNKTEQNQTSEKSSESEKKNERSSENSNTSIQKTDNGDNAPEQKSSQEHELDKNNYKNNNNDENDPPKKHSDDE